MKKIASFFLALLLMVLLISSASAEQTTLRYSYGQEALNKHLLDIMNTVEYRGKTYTFDFGDFSYNGAFTMLGGNTRTVQESEVPSVRMALIDPNADLYLGTVTITPSAEMQLYVFSGDRVSGQYTLIDEQRTATYTLDIYATRDENGTLRLIDKVFLYSYQQGGEEKCYAASLYVSYQGYQGASADTSPIDATMVHTAAASLPADEGITDEQDTPTGDLATYISMVKILEEERTRLSDELTQKSSELETLQSTNDTLTQQVNSLTAQLTQSQEAAASVTALNERIAQLEADNALLQADAAKASELTQQVNSLTTQLTQSQEAAASITALNERITQLESENTLLQAEAAKVSELTQQINSLTTQLTQGQEEAAGITTLNDRIAQLESENALLQADSAKVSELTQQVNSLTAQLTQSQESAASVPALNERIAQLEAENALLQAYEEISSISATASVAILLIALIIAIVGRIRKSRKLCTIASRLDFLSFILFVPFFVSVGCMFIYYGEAAGSSGTAVVSSVVLLIVWLLPLLLARGGKKAEKSSVEATVLPKNDSAAAYQMPDAKAEPASISVANKVNATVSETPEAKPEPASINVANSDSATVSETLEAKVEPANVSVASKVSATVPETKEAKAEPADGKVSNKVPKFLLVVGVLNILLCLYGGLGYLEIIKIALIGGAAFLGMKGKKALMKICGILVPVIAILPSVPALPYIGYWEVGGVLLFFAGAILSILFMIAAFTVKKIAPEANEAPGSTNFETYDRTSLTMAVENGGLSIFCTKCGNQVPNDSVFCTKCGNKLGEATTTDTPVEEVSGGENCEAYDETSQNMKAENDEAVVFCTKCGNQMGKDSTFCTKCGNKLGEATTAAAPVGGNVVFKSKKDFIYERFCRYMTINPLIVGFNPTFGELENYEEGANGMVYCELVASTRNALGKTKQTRFGAVIEGVEADGNVVFKGAGPQLMTPLNGTKMMKTLLGFKK